MSGRAASIGRKVAPGFRIVVFVRSRQRYDQSPGHVVRQAVHVVDLRREQQLADIGEDPIGLERTRRILKPIDGRGDAAGVKAFNDLDQLDEVVA